MSLAAQLMWFRLRGKPFKQFTFFPSVRYGSHVIDFYCPSRKLAILVGASEFEYRMQRELAAQGIMALRFTNEQIFYAEDSVLRSIQRELRMRFPQGALFPSREAFVAQTLAV